MIKYRYLYSLCCDFCGLNLGLGLERYEGVYEARKAAREEYDWALVMGKDVCRLCTLYAIKDAIEKREKEKTND